MAQNKHHGKFACLVNAPAFDMKNTEAARRTRKKAA